VSARTRHRIRAVAEELAYVVSPEASGLARGTKGRVAVVVPRLDVWFYSTMLAGVETALRAADLDVLVYQVDGQAQRTRFFAELPARRKVDAVVLAALPLGGDEVARLGVLGVHVVVAGGRVHDHPRVEVDDDAVAHLAVEHLVGLGHTRIAMVRTSDTEDTHWSSDLRRTAGYRAAMAQHDLAVPPEHVVTRPFGVRAGAEAMAELLDLPEPPTAVFAYSDELAVSMLSELWRRGLRAPDDISVVGVDGHPLGELFDVTTVVQSVEEQGRLAGDLVVALLRGDTDVVDSQDVEPVLVVRGSTGPPPAPAAT
jgi:DNA-binding LacI/PurR family transcriptional regulator